MLFYNLNKHSEKVDFRTATVQGLGSEKGLFFPEYVPVFPESWIYNLDNEPDEEIAWYVMNQYVGDSISEKKLREILNETISFEIPLIKPFFQDLNARTISRPHPGV